MHAPLRSDTSESVVLCECAGFDVVIVESVGVGQSEVSISECVDMLLLLVPPAGGDELQGMKKGIVEVADAVIVNKADGTLLPIARNTKIEYMHALKLYKRYQRWMPTVKLCSSLPSSSQIATDNNTADTASAVPPAPSSATTNTRASPPSPASSTASSSSPSSNKPAAARPGSGPASFQEIWSMVLSFRTALAVRLRPLFPRRSQTVCSLFLFIDRSMCCVVLWRERVNWNRNDPNSDNDGCGLS